MLYEVDGDDRVYVYEDGRLRVWITGENRIMSYPKYLMEKHLGRQLSDNEEVHHKDKNPLNNELSNLEIRQRGEHQAEHSKKFFDTMATCYWCGREFLWTGKQQQYFYSNRRNHNIATKTPFCSRQCSGQYGKSVQMSKHDDML